MRANRELPLRGEAGRLVSAPGRCGGVGATALIVSATFILATPSEAQVELLTPRAVEVDGNRVNVLTLGLGDRSSGEPVVVLQTGGGSTVNTWDGLFLRDIASLAPVVAYDRPGLGGSEFDGQDPTPQHIADHLAALLGVLGLGPPYILVGHSWGGPLILYFAAAHPDDIAGLVYLDPSLPSRPVPLPADPADRAAALAEIDSLREATFDWPAGRGAAARVSSDYWLTPPEQRAIPPNPDVPTAVILGTLVGRDVPIPARAEMRARHEGRVEDIRNWMGDVDLLHFVVTPNAGHFVHRDDPGLVLQGIEQVVEWAQQRN